MGVCHSNDAKKKKKNGNINNNTNNNPETKDNNDTTKLKSVNNRLNAKNYEYNINIIDSSNNNEYKSTIKGDKILIEILKENFKLNPNADFIIEFDNNEKIGIDKKNEAVGNIIFDIYNKNIPDIINLKYSYKGLEIPENAIQVYINNNKIIGNAIMDNSETFGIITYEKETKLISSYNYNLNEYPKINTLNNFTAYCNARNCLYFSGGEVEQTNDLDKTSLKCNDFFYIDLTLLNRDKIQLNELINELPNLNESRTWHSMIYVPNKYIFIVGGSNTKTVELYDMDEKKLTIDSELNEVRGECTLCLVNNMYLYAFFGFVLHQEYNNTIERCNLLTEKRTWEYVNYREKEGLDFNISFFGISYFKDNELLLIGENDVTNGKRYDYIYKIVQNEEEKDIIEEYDCELNENNIVFRDKFFEPIEENKTVNIPAVIGENIKIFILENGKINILNDRENYI